MMFRWTNKQPGIQNFSNLCSHYQDIYDWISPLNKRSGLPFILWGRISLWGENEYDQSGHFSIFTSLKQLWCFWGAFFFRASSYTLSKTLIACGDMQLRFLKAKTLLTMPLTFGIRLAAMPCPWEEIHLFRSKIVKMKLSGSWWGVVTYSVYNTH